MTIINVCVFFSLPNLPTRISRFGCHMNSWAGVDFFVVVVFFVDVFFRLIRSFEIMMPN